MQHLREAFVTIGVVCSMYLASSGLYFPLLSLLRNELDAFMWVQRLLNFALGALAGTLLMMLLTWRLRLLASMTIPIAVAIAVPLFSYFQMEPYGVTSELRNSLIVADLLVLLVYVFGMLVGALLVKHFATGKASELPPNKSLERTREG
jgi:hypothetical protein